MLTSRALILTDSMTSSILLFTDTSEHVSVLLEEVQMKLEA